MDGQYLYKDASKYQINGLKLPVYISSTQGRVSWFFRMLPSIVLPALGITFLLTLDRNNETYFHIRAASLILSIGVLFCWSTVVFFTEKLRLTGSRHISKAILLTVNELLNQMLVLKTDVFRNTPKWDLILLRMFIPVSSCVAIFMSSNIVEISLLTNLSVMGGALVIWLGLVYHFYNIKSSQYMLCHKDISKYLEELIKVNKNQDKRVLDLNASSLLIDLYHMDLWAHKTFREFFGFHLGKAIDYAFDNYFECLNDLDRNEVLENWRSLLDFLDKYIEPNSSIKESKARFIRSINEDSISQSDCRNLLNFYYQYSLNKGINSVENKLQDQINEENKKTKAYLKQLQAKFSAKTKIRKGIKVKKKFKEKKTA